MRERKVKMQCFHKTHYCCYILVYHFLNREYKMFSLCQNSNKSGSNSLHTGETLIKGAEVDISLITRCQAQHLDFFKKNIRSQFFS